MSKINPVASEVVHGDEIRYPEGPVDLTPSQASAITKIYSRAHKKQSLGGRNETETKEFTVQELRTNRHGYTTLSVIIEVGNPDDEGDLRSIFCRTRGHFFVGPMGGIEIAGLAYDSDFEGKRTKARKRPLIWGWK